MQGKLVEQRPEEGTGEELYQQIQKKKLAKEGKIKKQKPLPEITEDEIPFEIPRSWKWVRIGSVTELNPKNDVSDDVDASFIPMTLIDDGYRNHHTYEIKKWGSIKKGFTHFQNRDIGVAKITPCFQNRKSVIFKNLINGIGAGTTELSIVRSIEEYALPEFLLVYFKSEQFIIDGIKSFTGTAGQQRLHKDFLRTYLMPLPPLAEQKRIVTKIEEIMPFVVRYTTAYDKLQSYTTRFPNDLKKSILQQAIQGKLIPQDPNDEPASVLFEKITKEKEKLVKEGKIKKQKPLPEITEDEIPFEIPESWKWVRLNDVVVKNIKRGRSPSYAAKSHTLVLAQKCNTKAGYIDMSLAKYLNESKLPNYSTEEFMEDKDIVLNSTGNGTLGRVGIFRSADNPSGLPIVPDSHVTVIRITSLISSSFAFYYLHYYQPYMEKLGSGSTNQTELSTSVVQAILFPLPPLSEQRRIVAKIEKFMPLVARYATAYDKLQPHTSRLSAVRRKL